MCTCMSVRVSLLPFKSDDFRFIEDKLILSLCAFVVHVAAFSSLLHTHRTYARCSIRMKCHSENSMKKTYLSSSLFLRSQPQSFSSHWENAISATSSVNWMICQSKFALQIHSSHRWISCNCEKDLRKRKIRANLEPTNLLSCNRWTA